MNKRVSRSLWIGALIAMLSLGASPLSTARAHRPDDPYVRAIVDKGVGFLSTVTKREWGREALMGLALYKAGVDKNHPRLIQARDEVLDKVRKGIGGNDPPHIYPVALAAIFLCELDDRLYEKEIRTCLDVMIERQRPSGGFAYPNQQVPDISQTQYGVLAFWLADKHGFTIDPQKGVAALNYLIANQDPSGGFSYQGSTRGDRGVTHSMSAAGGGTIYIAASWLGYGEDADAVVRRPEEEGLPPSVRLVLIDEKTGQPIDRRKVARGGGGGKVDLDEGRLRGSQSRAEGWLKSNFSIRTDRWQYYYLYGYERYASFLEASKGVIDPEPEWYNQGVEFMKNTQLANGAWPDDKDETEAPEVSTAFAILFLVRSTKNSIGSDEWSDGRLLGGKGLSDDARTVMKGGRVTSLEVGRNVDDLMGLLSQTGDDQNFGALDSIDLITIDESSPELKSRQLATIRNLVAHQNPKTRLLAVKALASYQDLDNIPPLIYALTDPEPQIVVRANESLMQISRKFNDKLYLLPDKFKPNDSNVENVRKRWVEWYFTVQPNGELFRPTAQ